MLLCGKKFTTNKAYFVKLYYIKIALHHAEQYHVTSHQSLKQWMDVMEIL